MKLCYIPLAISGSSVASPSANILDVMIQVRHEVLAGGEKVISIALLIACILALFVLVRSTIDIASGNPTRAWTVIRPFVLILLVWGFHWAVMGPVDYVTNALDKGICAITADVQLDNVVTMFKEVKKQAEKEQKDKEKTDELNAKTTPDGLPNVLVAEDPEPGFIVQALRDFVKWIWGFAVSIITTAVSTVIMVLYWFVSTVLVIVSQMFLTMIGIIGPFVFALAVYKPLNGINNWIATYIQVSLWGPLASVSNYITQRALGFCSGMSVNQNAFGSETVLSNFASGGVYFVAVLLIGVAGICLTLEVPKIAGILISATGMNNAASGIGRGGKMLMSKIPGVGKFMG